MGQPETFFNLNLSSRLFKIYILLFPIFLHYLKCYSMKCSQRFEMDIHINQSSSCTFFFNTRLVYKIVKLLSQS